MDVTKVNFELIADEFFRLLHTCEFYAVDQEMSGIAVKDVLDDFGCSLEESYKAKKLAAERYLAFQMGICLFHKSIDPTSGKEFWEARPFNFWLRNGDGGEDIVLSMSATDFHVKNGMNFRKWMHEGMPFATQGKEEEERLRFFPPDPSAELNPAEKEWVESMMEKLKLWSSSTEASEPLVVEDKHVSTKADLALSYRVDAAGLTIVADPGLHTGLPAWKRTKTTYKVVSAEEMKNLKSADVKRRNDIVNRKIGFRRFFIELCKCRKPHVGHNYFTDILFMMHIHDQPLADTLHEHRRRVHEAFPQIVDTKVLLNALPEAAAFENSALEPAFEESEKKCYNAGKAVPVKLPLGFERYDKTARVIAERCNAESICAHHAAYDAYMTGVLLLRLRELFGVEHEQKWTNHVAVFGSVFFWRVDSEETPYANCTPFHVEFPEQLPRSSLEALFYSDAQKKKADDYAEKIKDAKGRVQPLKNGMYFRWLNDNSAIVGHFPEVKQCDAEEWLSKNRAAIDDEDDPLKKVVVRPFAEWRAAVELEGPRKKARKEE